MKRRHLQLAACLVLPFVLALTASAAPTAATAKAQAAEMMKQRDAGEFEAYVGYLHTTALDAMGGKAAAPATAKGMAAYENSNGTKTTHATGDASEPVTAGGKSYVVVPLETIQESGGQKSVTKGYLVGVSADDGATWKFVDGTMMQPSSIRSWLMPDLPASVKLPGE